MQSPIISDGVDWSPLDEACHRAISACGQPWLELLLSQTVITAPERRRIFSETLSKDVYDVLDVGTGFGVMLLEMARLAPIHAVGIDTDGLALRIGSELVSEMAAVGWCRGGGDVQLREATAEALPFQDGSFDLLTARLVVQHLERPIEALVEARRVLRPGGRIVIFDVDDGLSATWPPPLPESDRLDDAYAAMQSSRRGDREIGRKLPTLMLAAGFRPDAPKIVSQTSFSAVPARVREMTELRYRADKVLMLATGLLDDEEFERCLRVLREEPQIDRLRVESQVVATATKV